MKFLFNLFVALLSVSCLIAQSNNRLELPLQRQEMEDRRWEIEVEVQGCRVQETNQVRGCRLQVVGCNQETACTEQVRNSSKKTLPLEDQIAQGAKTTTNYNNQATGYRGQGKGLKTTELLSEKLRTTNCNNSDVDLNCYLMMNPEEIRKAEEAFEFSGKHPVPSEITTFRSIEMVERSGLLAGHGGVGENSAKRPFSELAESAASFVVPEVEALSSFIPNSSVEIPLPVDSTDSQSLLSYVPPIPVPSSVIASLKEDPQISNEKDVLQAQEKESLALEGKLLAQIAQENIARLTEEIEEAKQACEEGQGVIAPNLYDLWKSFIVILERSRDSWKKVSELVEQGKVERAFIWRKVAEESEISVEGIRRAVQVYISGSTGKGNKLEDEAWRDYYSLNASTRALKKEEALEKADQMQGERRDFWRSCLSSQYKKTASYCICYPDESNRYERHYWAVAADSLYYQGDYLVKACEAEKAGKEALSECYKKASFLSEKAAMQFSTAKERGLSTRENNVGKSFQAMAGYLVKASEAEEIGKVVLATGYREAAASFERAVEQYEKSLLTKSSDNLYYKVHSLNAKAEYQAKAIETQEDGNILLAAIYRDSAAILEGAVEQYQQSALAFASGNESEGIRYRKIGISLDTLSAYQVMAAEKKEKEKFQGNVINTNNMTLDTIGVDDNFNKEVPNRKKINNSTTMQALFICCEKWLAETGATSGSDQFLSDYVIDVIQRGADYKLVSAFEEYRNNAIKAHEIGDDSQTLGWIQMAEDMQQAINDSIKYGKCSRLDPVKAIQKIVEYRKKYITIPIASQTPEIMKEWKKIIEGSESVANYYRKYQEVSSLRAVYILRKVEEYSSALSKKLEQECEVFCKVGKYMSDYVKLVETKIEFLKKSMLVCSEEQPELSTFRRKILEQYEKSEEFYRQAASSWVDENAINSYRFENTKDTPFFVAYRLEAVSIALGKTIKIREANNAEVEALWMKALELYQKSFEHYRQIMHVVMKRDTRDSSYVSDGTYYVNHATYQLDLVFSALEKITNVSTKNCEEAINIWFKAVNQCYQSNEYYNNAVEAKLRKDEIDGRKWDKEAEFLSESAKQLDSKADQLNLIAETFKKATVAEAEGKQFAAALWRKKAESYQEEFQRKNDEK